MRVVCFPHFYYLSEASRLVEIAKSLRNRGQEALFFSHGGPYEHIARDEGFEVVSVEPRMTPDRAQQYIRFNRGEGIKSLKDSFFTYEELKSYVPNEANAFKNVRADAVLIGWNLPSYLSVQLADIPIIVQQPGPFTAPFFDRKMGVFVPSLVPWLRHLPMDWFMNWFARRMTFWTYPFNQLASELRLTRIQEHAGLRGRRPDSRDGHARNSGHLAGGTGELSTGASAVLPASTALPLRWAVLRQAPG